MPPYDYLLRLQDEDGEVNIEVSGAIPRVGERVRIVRETGGEQRYYEVRDVLHSVLEENVDVSSPRNKGESELPQVMAFRKKDQPPLSKNSN